MPEGEGRGGRGEGRDSKETVEWGGESGNEQAKDKGRERRGGEQGTIKSSHFHYQSQISNTVTHTLLGVHRQAQLVRRALCTDLVPHLLDSSDHHVGVGIGIQVRRLHGKFGYIHRLHLVWGRGGGRSKGGGWESIMCVCACVCECVCVCVCVCVCEIQTNMASMPFASHPLTSGSLHHEAFLCLGKHEGLQGSSALRTHVWSGRGL